jgi:hypothetical protein
VRELGDTGIAAEVDQEQLPAPDLLLNITATINSEMNEDKTQAKQLVVCTASVTYTLTDAKGKVLADTQYASGTIKTPSPKPGEKLSEMRNVREITRYYDPSTKQWRSAGGFDPSNPEGAAALVRQTLDSPLKGLVAKLAMALPLTTQVTGISGSKSMFSVGAGQRNGIFRGGKVVVWYSDGDFSYPIAETTAEPTVDKCNLKIVSWNDGDADAKPIIDKIVTDVHAALALPANARNMIAQGADPVGNGPEAFRAFLAHEITRWREIVRIAGALPE